MKCEIGHFLRLYFLDILAEMAKKISLDLRAKLSIV